MTNDNNRQFCFLENLSVRKATHAFLSRVKMTDDFRTLIDTSCLSKLDGAAVAL